MKIKKPHSINDYLWGILSIAVVLVIFAGRGIFSYAAEKIVLIALITIFFLFFDRNNVRINHCSSKYIWIYTIIIIYLLFNYFNSYDQTVSRPYLLRFLVLFVFLFVSFNIYKLVSICKMIRCLAVFVAVVYIICWPFQGVNGGLLQDYQYTAQTLSLSIGFFIPLLFENKKIKFKDVISIGFIFGAILLTGKRSLFVIPIIMVLIIAILSDDYKKYRKFFGFTLTGIFLIMILAFVAPSTIGSITRLLDTASDTTMNSRTYFWEYALMLWRRNPLFGIGFGCFPAHIATGGVNLANYGYIQAYLAHNIYYQMLAEIGIVGLIIFCVFFATAIISCLRNIKLIKRSGDFTFMPVSLISFYCIIWFLLYGITGNPLYMAGQLFVLFFGIVLDISLKEYLYNEGALKIRKVKLSDSKLLKRISVPALVTSIVAFGSCFALVFFVADYLEKDISLSENIDDMIEKADHLWDKGKTDLALYQLNVYCSYREDDKEAAIKLADWYEEIGDTERALVWYQNATFADTPDKSDSIVLTGAENVAVLTEKSEVDYIKFEVSAKHTKDVKLSIYSENLFSDYVVGAVDGYDGELIKDSKYLTSEWFPVAASEDYLTMHGGFNMADWQFMDIRGEVIGYSTLDTSENVNLTYRELDTVSIYNMHTSVVKIPNDAVYARVTYLCYDKENSASLQDEVQIVHGRLIQPDITFSNQVIQLPDLNEGDVIFYKDGIWTLTSDNVVSEINLPEVDMLDNGTLLSLNGTLLGRLSIGIVSQDIVTDGEYGVRWNVNDTDSVCERIGDATGLHFNYYLDNYWANFGENDFDNIYPWSDIKLCAIREDGSIIYSDDNGFESNGSVGDIFVEIPMFYVKREVVDEYEYIWITASQKEGYQIDPAFITESGVQEHIYIAAYQSSTDGKESIESKSGAIPLINMSLNELRGGIEKKGINYGEMDLTTLMMVQRLFIVESGIKNSQSLFTGVSKLNYFNADSAQCALESVNNSNSITITRERGFGVGDAVAVITQQEWDNFENIPDVTQRIITSVEKVDNGYYIEFSGQPVDVIEGVTYIYNIPRINGTVDDIDYCTGVMTDAFSGTESFKYRYIENLWGNGAVLLDGCYEENYQVYVKYPNGTETVLGYTLPIQDNLPGSSEMVASETIVMRMGYDEENPFIMLPSVLGNGASFTNSFGDTFYMHENLYSVNKRCLAYGGCWDGQNYAGLFNYRIQITEDGKAKENTSRMIYRK